MELVIITGMSGAGKSQAVKVLEDMNYYCMDNLPPMLLLNFAELCKNSTKAVEKIALVADIRGGIFFDDLFKSLEELKNRGINYRILFLDASDEVLVKRYKELRRPHPISEDGNILDGIKNEREILSEVKDKADYIIDTSKLKLGRLKEEIVSIFRDGNVVPNITLSFVSFGFKYGIPSDADMVMDVRFLPNPYYIEPLKTLTGNSKEVQDYVMGFEVSRVFFNKLIDMLTFLIPNYIEEGKTNLVVAIGCTGGKHRSVTLANKLGEYFENDNYRTVVLHRDDVK